MTDPQLGKIESQHMAHVNVAAYFGPPGEARTMQLTSDEGLSFRGMVSGSGMFRLAYTLRIMCDEISRDVADHIERGGGSADDLSWRRSFRATLEEQVDPAGNPLWSPTEIDVLMKIAENCL